MKKILLVAGMVMLATPVHAEYLYGYGNISANYADWSDGTEERSNGLKEDFVYLELEGGAGFDWGELYGFIDLENVQDGDGETRTAFKGTISYKVGLDELRIYGQSYGTHADTADWFIQNNVLGLSYKFSGDNWWFSPFVGAHHTNTTAFTGMNGGMLGWNAGVNFTAFDEKFMLANWHESEFSRVDEYVNKPFNSETDDVSMNGAIGLYWHVTDEVSTGIQYRYAYNKLGQRSNANAMIYSVRYNF